MRTVMMMAATALILCACGPQRPAIDPALDSGVRSSNGGGQRATGGIPSVQVGPGVTTTTGAPAGTGNSY